MPLLSKDRLILDASVEVSDSHTRHILLSQGEDLYMGGFADGVAEAEFRPDKYLANIGRQKYLLSLTTLYMIGYAKGVESKISGVRETMEDTVTRVFKKGPDYK